MKRNLFGKIEKRNCRVEGQLMPILGRIEFIYDQSGLLIKKIEYKGDGSVWKEPEK